MSKTKQQILFEAGNMELPDGIYPGMMNDKIYHAIDEYAKQHRIALMEWLTRKDCQLAILYGDDPLRFCDNDREYTIEQVDTLFLQSQSQ